MAQQVQQKTTNTFIKGLVTEAGELTFPKDASIDELNCDLKRTGARTRRFGIEYETNYELTTEAVTSSSVVYSGVWENVGEEAGTEFSVVQIDNKLIFFQKNGPTLSTNRVPTSKTDSTPYFINLSTYSRIGGTGAGTKIVSLTSIRGALIVASSEMETIKVVRDAITGSFSVNTIDFFVRDFEWLDAAAEYTEPSVDLTASPERIYDTYNAGWTEAALNTYTTARTAYPPLTHPWFSGKTTVGTFSVAEFEKVYAGTSRTSNGHFILNLFNKDREGASGVTGLTTSTEEARFSSVATYAGRVFYSGLNGSTSGNSSRVFFSQLLVGGLDDIGKCYQQSDPTSEWLSDLFDTDGGYIEISDAYNIQKLHVFGPALYIFAENGVWTVSGVEKDVFRATDYYITKLTDIGLAHPNSFISADGRPYWWSTVGIHTLVSGEDGSIKETNLSLGTIQSFWEAIDSTIRDKAFGLYDAISNRVMWLYGTNDATVDYKYNRVLILDEVLKAFFPWEISDKDVGTPYIMGASFYDGEGSSDVSFTVVDSLGNEVVDSLGNTVTVDRPARNSTSSRLKFLVKDGTTNKLTYAEFTNDSFLDWGSEDYSSYAEAEYDFMGDLTLKKNAPYITVYCKETSLESSLYLSSFWDFKDTSSSKPQQAYCCGAEHSVSVRRLKTRGRGRNMRLKFEGETGKDFHLLGYEVIVARNSRL